MSGYVRESIAIDPSCTGPCGTADRYRLLGAPGAEAGPTADLLERARTVAGRALALDPQLTEASAVLSMVRFSGEWDLAGAMRDTDRGIALNPSLARAHRYRSAVLTVMGGLLEAAEAARRA